jgi:hypothetical protein
MRPTASGALLAACRTLPRHHLAICSMSLPITNQLQSNERTSVFHQVCNHPFWYRSISERTPKARDVPLANMPFSRNLVAIANLVQDKPENFVLISKVPPACRVEDVQNLLDSNVAATDIHFFEGGRVDQLYRQCVVNMKSAAEAHRIAMEKHGSFLLSARTDVLWIKDYSFHQE